jgi:hypothetical protein
MGPKKNTISEEIFSFKNLKRLKLSMQRKE